VEPFKKAISKNSITNLEIKVPKAAPETSHFWKTKVSKDE
jgi:hypothetical protein